MGMFLIIVIVVMVICMVIVPMDVDTTMIHHILIIMETVVDHLSITRMVTHTVHPAIIVIMDIPMIVCIRKQIESKKLPFEKPKHRF
jgi:hypothetical protein